MPQLLSDLPLDELIFPLLDVASLMRIQCTSKAFGQLISQATWSLAVRSQWGPIENTCGDWRRLAKFLEKEVLQTIRCKSVKLALKSLLVAKHHLPDTEDAWHETLRCVLRWCSLAEARRITAFVCADWQPKHTVARFLAPFTIRGSTPEKALRDLLPIFPFLPIDAGSGADRVIGAFSVAFLRQNKRALDALCLGGEDDLARASSSDDDDGGGDPSDHSVRACLSLVPMPHERAARDAIYTLTYSLIMLNTDLHNAAVQPKITAQQYSDSCRRCAPLRNADASLFLDIYRNISRHPLQISSGSFAGRRGVDQGAAGVATAVRAMEDGLDAETPATFSRYSTLRPMAQRAEADPTTAAAILAARAAAEASVGQRGVKVDWNVAYWNCVDAVRYAKASAWRCVGQASSFRARRWAELYGTVAVIALSYALRKAIIGAVE